MEQSVNGERRRAKDGRREEKGTRPSMRRIIEENMVLTLEFIAENFTTVTGMVPTSAKYRLIRKK
jgi:hypothetical protein